MIGKILRFTKIEHTAFSLPLLLTGAWMGGDHRIPSFATLGLILTAAVGARVFGMAMNRIFDRHIDARNPRTAGRELPTGKLSVLQAGLIATTGLTVYLAGCLALGGWCLALSPLPLIPLLGYSLLKRFTVLCHFGIGLCLALAPLGAFVAAAGHPRFSVQVLWFAAFVFFWLSGADIIYALMDIGSDRQNGIFSLPARLGAAKAQIVAGGAHLVALGCLMVVLSIDGLTAAGTMAFAATTGLFIMMYWPSVPVPMRFFPIATLAGVAGAIAPMLA